MLALPHVFFSFFSTAFVSIVCTTNRFHSVFTTSWSMNPHVRTAKHFIPIQILGYSLFSFSSLKTTTAMRTNHTKWFGRKKVAKTKKIQHSSTFTERAQACITSIECVNLWINNFSLVLIFIHKTTTKVAFQWIEKRRLFMLQIIHLHLCLSLVICMHQI